MPDPVSQIYMQAAGGSAEGQGFGQFAVEGRRLAQNQQQLNLSQRRLQFEEEQARAREPLLRLERQRLLQQMAVTSLEFQKTQSDNSYAISLRDSELQVSRFMSELAQNGAWGSPESWARWEEITNRVPLAAVSKAGQLFLQQQRLAMANQRLAKQFGAPTKVTVPTAEGGDATFGDAPRSVTADIQNQQHADKLRTQIAGLPEGSPERLQAEQSLAEFNTTRMPSQKEHRTIVRPDGTTEIIYGPSTSGLTPSQSGTAKLKATRMVDTSRRIGELIPKADQIFGPKAAAQTLIVDRVLANLVPGLAEGERIEGRATAGLVIEGLIRSLSEGQGALSNQDVARLKAKFPELNNPSELIESPARAKLILKSLQKEMARDAYGQFRLIGEQLTDEVLENLDPVFLVEELDKGRITRDQFKRAVEASPYTEEINQLIERNKKK